MKPNSNFKPNTSFSSLFYLTKPGNRVVIKSTAEQGIVNKLEILQQLLRQLPILGGELVKHLNAAPHHVCHIRIEAMRHNGYNDGFIRGLVGLDAAGKGGCVYKVCPLYTRSLASIRISR